MYFLFDFLYTGFADHQNLQIAKNKIIELRDSVQSCENFIYYTDSLRTERFNNLIMDSLKTEKFRISTHEQTGN
jgi:uracil phosphoribosyltransferase